MRIPASHSTEKSPLQVRPMRASDREIVAEMAHCLWIKDEGHEFAPGADLERAKEFYWNLQKSGEGVVELVCDGEGVVEGMLIARIFYNGDEKCAEVGDFVCVDQCVRGSASILMCVMSERLIRLGVNTVYTQVVSGSKMIRKYAALGMKEDRIIFKGDLAEIRAKTWKRASRFFDEDDEDKE